MRGVLSLNPINIGVKEIVALLAFGAATLSSTPLDELSCFSNIYQVNIKPDYIYGISRNNTDICTSSNLLNQTVGDISARKVSLEDLIFQYKRKKCKIKITQIRRMDVSIDIEEEFEEL